MLQSLQGMKVPKAPRSAPELQILIDKLHLRKPVKTMLHDANNLAIKDQFDSDDGKIVPVRKREVENNNISSDECNSDESSELESLDDEFTNKLVCTPSSKSTAAPATITTPPTSETTSTKLSAGKMKQLASAPPVAPMSKDFAAI